MLPAKDDSASRVTFTLDHSTLGDREEVLYVHNDVGDKPWKTQAVLDLKPSIRGDT
jgi:hypothetical protein